MDSIMTIEKFEKILLIKKEYDMVISLIGLPVPVEKLKMLNVKDAKKGKKIVIQNGDIKFLKHAFKNGRIVACLRPNPAGGFNFGERIPKDEAKAFNRRYILITPENVDEMDAQYKDLFTQKD